MTTRSALISPDDPEPVGQLGFAAGGHLHPEAGAWWRSFSAGTELFSTVHSPARSSLTSTVAALSVALRTVTR